MHHSPAEDPRRAPSPSLVPVEDHSLSLAVLGLPLIAFVVRGAPAPQGSKNSFTNRKTGKTMSVESSKAVKPWRTDVANAVVDAKPAGWVPLDAPVVLDLIFSVRRPGGEPKTRRTFPQRSPDLDKLVRSTLDGLKTGGLYADDARVVAFRRLREFYAGDPDADALPAGETGAIIRAWTLPIEPFTAVAATPPPPAFPPTLATVPVNYNMLQPPGSVMIPTPSHPLSPLPVTPALVPA